MAVSPTGSQKLDQLLALSKKVSIKMPDCAGCGHINNDNGDCHFSKAREAYIIEQKRIPQGIHLGNLLYAGYCNFRPSDKRIDEEDYRSLSSDFKWIAVKKNDTYRYMFFPLFQIKKFVTFPEEKLQQNSFNIFGKW